MGVKKIFALLLILVMTINSIPLTNLEVNAAETSGFCGAPGNEENVRWNFDSSTKTLTIDGTGAMADYRYDYFDGEWKVNSPWYNYKNITKNIRIKDISIIGSHAFSYFSEVENIVFDGNIREIKEFAFSGKKVEKLLLPDSLKIIGDYAFSDFKLIRELVLPSGITEIGHHAFAECYNLDSVEIPGSLANIPGSMFIHVNLQQLKINNGVKRVGPVIASSINRLEFPSSIEFIEDGLIYGNRLPEYVYGANEYTQQWAYMHNIKYVDTSVKMDINNANIQGINSDYEYANGEGITPKPQITFDVSDDLCGDVTINLDEGIDYRIDYYNNINEGTATATITGLGYFAGTKTINFNVYKKIENASVAISPDSFLYDGTAKNPSVTVKYGNDTLKESRDYTLTYSNNTNEGTANITIAGINNYKGTVTKGFSIYKNKISDSSVTLEYDSILYDGTEKKPKVNVRHSGNILEENKDYTISYTNNLYPGTASVNVTGIGLYKGSVSIPFSIESLSIGDADVTLKKTIYTYDGSPKRPSVVVKIGSKVLTKDSDYSVSYKDNVDEGTAYVYITGQGIYSDAIKASFVILGYNAGMESMYDDDTFISKSIVYSVSDDEDKEVEVCCPASKNIKSLTIPKTVNVDGVAYKVVSVGQKAFYKNPNIQSVTIGNSIKNIENYAFYGCKNLKTIKMGSKVDIIGASSFRNCTKLTSITLPKSVDELGKNAFYGCKRLKLITINASSVIDVEDNAIKGISTKAVIKVPKKLYKKYKKEFSKKTGFKKSMKFKKF